MTTLTLTGEASTILAVRSLRADAVRAYLGLLLGISAGLGLEVAFGRYDVLLGTLTLFAIPLAFLAISLGYGAQHSAIFAGRLLGAYGGWIGMWVAIGLAFSNVYQLGGSALALVLLAAAFMVLVPAGMIAGDRTRSWIQRAMLQSK